MEMMRINFGIAKSASEKENTRQRWTENWAASWGTPALNPMNSSRQTITNAIMIKYYGCSSPRFANKFWNLVLLRVLSWLTWEKKRDRARTRHSNIRCDVSLMRQRGIEKAPKQIKFKENTKWWKWREKKLHKIKIQNWTNIWEQAPNVLLVIHSFYQRCFIQLRFIHLCFIAFAYKKMWEAKSGYS